MKSEHCHEAMRSRFLDVDLWMLISQAHFDRVMVQVEGGRRLQCFDKSVHVSYRSCSSKQNGILPTQLTPIRTGTMAEPVSTSAADRRLTEPMLGFDIHFSAL